MKGNPITIKDLAKLMGVSVSTISRALKDHPDISEETKDAIKTLARSLNYRPSQVALSLRLKKSKVIGVLLPKIYSYFYPTVVKGIEEIANHSGYTLLIMQSNEEYEKEVESVNILLANNVEGVLATVSRQTHNFDHFKAIQDANVPVIFFDRVPDVCISDMVLLDDIRGAEMATQHLIDNRKSRIAICIGYPDLLISINRLKGYRNALSANGMPFDSRYVVSAQSPEEAAEKTGQLLDLPQPPDSIIAISDLTMSGIVQETYQRKVKIPDQLSLIGFCEDTFCKMYNPQLTAISPKAVEIGRLAASLLMEKINNPKTIDSTAKTHLIEPALSVRDSV